MHANSILAPILLFAALSVLACEPGHDDDSTGPRSPTAYDAPFRSDAQLRAELDALCRTARKAGRPLLVEFSAAWCSDCRRLHEMKQDPALASELVEWPSIVVNVGRFDRHRPLLATLRVASIAHWEVLAPSDCDKPIGGWPSLARRTLEVSSGAARNLAPSDLAGWLSAIRTADRR